VTRLQRKRTSYFRDNVSRNLAKFSFFVEKAELLRKRGLVKILFKMYISCPLFRHHENYKQKYPLLDFSEKIGVMYGKKFSKEKEKYLVFNFYFPPAA
jgi:hypothetical protein